MAKDTDFDGIEIRGLGNDIFAVKTPPFSDKKIDETIATLKKLHLEIPCLSTGCPLKDFDKIEENLDEIKQYVELAKKLGLPVIVHIRDCTEDCMEILKKHKPKGVVHCFSGSAETASEVLALGMYISFTGALTFKGAKRAAKAIAVVPLDRLLLETDCPYMTPEPIRPGRCQSDMIEFTARKAAQIKGVEVQHLVNMCTENTIRLFNIG